VLDLVARTYDAALDERLWMGLGPEIARTFGSTSAALRVRNLRTGYAPLLTATANYSVENIEQYAAYYWRHDKWANRAARLGMSRILTSADLIEDSELERSEWYEDWLRKLQIFYIVGTIFPIGGDEVCTLGIHRGRADGAYGAIDKVPVARYLPHLKRALAVRQQLAHARVGQAATLDALERTATATLVLDRDGRLLYANGRAERLLAMADGLGATAGRLRAADRTAGERLATLIRDAADGTGTAGGALALPRGDRLPLTALVAPLPAAQDGWGWTRPAAILFVRDPEQPTPSGTALQELFGLTPAEAALAAALAAGQTVEAHAAAHRISLNTARTHLKSALAKTGTGRQAELVALLLRSAALLGNP
jgi:DNA-binding CsgD family transcriptional regulator/PAS domain-containing protein